MRSFRNFYNSMIGMLYPFVANDETWLGSEVETSQIH
jgi:hypothetical protein